MDLIVIAAVIVGLFGFKLVMTAQQAGGKREHKSTRLLRSFRWRFQTPCSCLIKACFHTHTHTHAHPNLNVVISMRIFFYFNWVGLRHVYLDACRARGRSRGRARLLLCRTRAGARTEKCGPFSSLTSGVRSRGAAGAAAPPGGG